MQCTIEQAKEKLLNKIDWKSSQSPAIILIGSPGIGKTELIASIVLDRLIEIQKVETSSEFPEFIKNYIKAGNITHHVLDYIADHFLMIRLGERPIEQLQGVVIPSLSTDYVRFVLPENVMKIKKSDWGIIFLDELDKASESKMAAATNLLENKILGDFHLPKGWIVLAACNREEDSFLSNPLPAELRNRAAIIEMTCDFESWAKWARNKVRSEILGFLHYCNGEWLAKYDLETYAFPTPRSWTMASRSLDRLYSRNKSSSKEEFCTLLKSELNDFVGPAASAAFALYVDEYLKYPIEEILDGTKNVARLAVKDQIIAAIAVADRLTPDLLSSDDSKDKTKNLIQFMLDLSEEVRALFLQSIHKSRILNMIMDSGLADNLMAEIIEYIGG